MRYYIVRKDIIKRNLFSKFEYKKRILKFMQQNMKLKNQERFGYSKALTQLPKNSSITRIRNRCIITGRSRSVYRDFRLTRMQLRSLAGFGLLMGVRKSSW